MEKSQIEEENRVQQAIGIALQSHVLESFRTAEQVLAGWVQQIPGFQGVIGWRATAFGNGVYLVSYMVNTASGERGWFFEVNLATQAAVKVTGDSVLEAKYGFAPALAPTPAQNPRQPLSTQRTAKCRQMADQYKAAIRSKDFNLVEEARGTSQSCVTANYVGPCREVINRYEQLAYRAVHGGDVSDQEIASTRSSEKDCFTGH